MGLRINTNVISLQAQNRLQATSKRLNQALTRLSTGLRINKGSDDVVGLSKSESLRSQIRGISTAELNISNAGNLLGVAEGSLSQLNDIGQRMREILVQGADATISSTDRTNLTTALSDLQNEFARLVSAAEFDGVKLLDGTFTAKTFQVGPNGGNTISFSITDSRSSQIGKAAVYTAVTLSDTATGTSGLDLTGPSNLVINGVTISSSAFTADGVSNVESDESAIAYVTAINSVAGQTGVSAQVLSNVVTLSLNGATNLAVGDRVIINGVTLGALAVDETSASEVNAFVEEINSHSTSTGVTAAYDAATSIIVLTAGDGRNVDVAVTGTLTGDVLGLGIGGLSDSGAIVFRGTFRLASDSTFTTANSSTVLGSGAATVSLSNNFTLDKVDVLSSLNAETGIFILDNVIRQLQSRRADVGSKAIRIEIAANELAVRKENLTESESRIRDADIAAETAALTSAQILQQAGVTVLARANAIPQIALTLLQG